MQVLLGSIVNKSLVYCSNIVRIILLKKLLYNINKNYQWGHYNMIREWLAKHSKI